MKKLLFPILFSVLSYLSLPAQNWQQISEEPFYGGSKAVYTLRADTAIDGLYVGGDFDGIGNNSSLRSSFLYSIKTNLFLLPIRKALVGF